ncbi:unnamed protein product, partial [Durusdinium trenchii]
ATFCSSGHYEFDLETDAGIGNDFWNQKLNVAACKLRVQRAHQLPLENQDRSDRATVWSRKGFDTHGLL